MKCKIKDGNLVYKCPGCKDGHVIPFDKLSARGGYAWSFNNDLDKPTLSPSINAWTDGWTDPEDPTFHIPLTRCHHFLKDGMIQFLSDCTHELANQTVAMIDMPETWI